MQITASRARDAQDKVTAGTVTKEKEKLTAENQDQETPKRPDEPYLNIVRQ